MEGKRVRTKLDCFLKMGCGDIFLFVWMSSESRLSFDLSFGDSDCEGEVPSEDVI